MKRAEVVRRRIVTLVNEIKEKKSELGTLLFEVREKEYHFDYGFQSFKDWLEQSGLGIGEREASYLMNITSKAAELGLSSKLLDTHPTSHLKAIFTLDPDENQRAIKELLAASTKGATLKEIKTAVCESAGRQVQVIYSIGFSSDRSKNNVAKIIDGVQESKGFQTKGQALDFICKEFNKARR